MDDFGLHVWRPFSTFYLEKVHLHFIKKLLKIMVRFTGEKSTEWSFHAGRIIDGRSSEWSGNGHRSQKRASHVRYAKNNHFLGGIYAFSFFWNQCIIQCWYTYHKIMILRTRFPRISLTALKKKIFFNKNGISHNTAIYFVKLWTGEKYLFTLNYTKLYHQ